MKFSKEIEAMQNGKPLLSNQNLIINFKNPYMKHFLTLSLLIVFSAVSLNAQSSCDKAKQYEQKLKDANENWTPDERARNNCPQGWSQVATWYAAKCKCDKGLPSKKVAEQYVATMNGIRATIQSQYSHCGEVPPVMSVSQVKITGGNNAENNSDKEGIDAESDPVLQYTGYEGKYQRLKDEYIKTFSNTKTYNAYVQGENIKRTGIILAKELSGGLDQINTEIESSNPDNILREFNRKVQQIEQLEASFNEQNNRYSFDAGVEIGNSISSKDWETGFHQLGGLINAGVEAREARAELQAKRQALYQARRNKMSQIYWKAVDYNQAQRKKYLKAAAYAKNKEDEAYYLAFVDNLDCFLEKMEKNFSVNNTLWLKNNCPVPVKKESAVLNTGQSESENLIQAAERKYELFLRTQEDEFRKAAISFAGYAVKTQPKSEYFVKLADYYKNYSYILEYTALLSANAYAEKPSERLKNRTERLQKRVNYEINTALDYNDIEYLKTFLDFDLDKIVLIDNKNILDYAIEQDKPKAVLTILNHKNKNKSKNQISANINNVLMLSAVNNSPKTIKTLIENGVSTDIKINGATPTDAASKFLNAEVFEVLIKAPDMKAETKQKFKDAPVQILIQAQDDPINAAKVLDMKSTEQVMGIIEYVLNPDDSQPQYLSLLGNSAKAKLLIFSDKQLTHNMRKIFYDELKKRYPDSKAYVILETGLLSFDDMPNLSDLEIQKTQSDKKSSERPLTYGEETELLIENYISKLGRYENWKPDPQLIQGMDAKTQKEFISGRKDIHDTMIKDIKEEIQWLEQIKNKDNEENRKATLKELLLNSRVLSEQGLWQQYGYYYAENYMRTEPYSYQDKINFLIKAEEIELEEKIEKAKAAGEAKDVYNFQIEVSNSVINLYKRFLEGEEKLSLQDKERLSLHLGAFNRTLIEHGKPMDAKAVEEYFGISIQGNSKNDVNLAYYARENDNRRLFGALDKQFDLSKVKNSDGKSLLETIIIKEGFIAPPPFRRETDVNTRQLFYSKDFEFERKSRDGYDLVYLFLNQLVKQTDYPIEVEQFDYSTKTYAGNLVSIIFHHFYEVCELYDFDLNRKITPSGGTFLHWFVDMLIAYTPDQKMEDIGNASRITKKVAYKIDSLMVDAFRRFIASNKELNKNAVDNNGLTAYEYYKKNEDKIYPYIDNHSNYETEKTKNVMKEILK